jgi:ribonuclease HII
MTSASLTLAGVDEVGRGPIAGPVVAVACTLDPGLCIKKRNGWVARQLPDLRVTDSKKLSPVARARAAAWLSQNSQFGIGVSSVCEINKFGIVAATQFAMSKAVAALQKKTTVSALSIDGKPVFHFNLPHTFVIRGDQSVLQISAASILAKVHRDTLMTTLDEVYPGYCFGKHKGYGTAEHRRAVLKLGITPEHRTLFTQTWLSDASAKRAKSKVKRQK